MIASPFVRPRYNNGVAAAAFRFEKFTIYAACSITQEFFPMVHKHSSALTHRSPTSTPPYILTQLYTPTNSHSTTHSHALRFANDHEQVENNGSPTNIKTDRHANISMNQFQMTAEEKRRLAAGGVKLEQRDSLSAPCNLDGPRRFSEALPKLVRMGCAPQNFQHIDDNGSCRPSVLNPKWKLRIKSSNLKRLWRRDRAELSRRSADTQREFLIGANNTAVTRPRRPAAGLVRIRL
ncbi:hypothetical protein EVAR_76215_1 [Eumeta japonica]|uniref:Uncharacterized protein n=1 Tax=Eumeta variegata TaxID=151549 RepID=A0A4C1UNU3_EUMVA|nr:hypothetical protein EVAR_76215_1 [Eumeta japonica]